MKGLDGLLPRLMRRETGPLMASCATGVSRVLQISDCLIEPIGGAIRHNLLQATNIQRRDCTVTEPPCAKPIAASSLIHLLIIPIAFDRAFIGYSARQPIRRSCQAANSGTRALAAGTVMRAQPSPDARRVTEQTQTKVAGAVRADPICTLAQQGLGELATALAARDAAMIATALVTVKEAEAILLATYGDSSPEISKLIATCADAVRQSEERFRGDPQDRELVTRVRGELVKFEKERDSARDSLVVPREEPAATDIDALSQAPVRPSIASRYDTIT